MKAIAIRRFGGPEVLELAAHGALRAGGTFVTLVRPFAPVPIRGTRVVAAAYADGPRLAELPALAQAERLRLPSATRSRWPTARTLTAVR